MHNITVNRRKRAFRVPRGVEDGDATTTGGGRHYALLLVEPLQKVHLGRSKRPFHMLLVAHGRANALKEELEVELPSWF